MIEIKYWIFFMEYKFRKFITYISKYRLYLFRFDSDSGIKKIAGSVSGAKSCIREGL
jgi:hypothetical protein